MKTILNKTAKRVILLLLLLAGITYAEMTKPCQIMYDEILTGTNKYTALKQDHNFKQAHKVITKVVTYMAWTEVECSRDNPEDLQFMKMNVLYFNQINSEKEKLDAVYGKIDYRYERR